MNKLFLTTFVFASVSCSGGAPQMTEEEQRAAILDAPIERRTPTPTESREDDEEARAPEMLDLPEPPKEPKFTIDGKEDDWKGKRFRTFNKASSVESGERFWSGAADASMRVAVDSDEGWFYAFVDVRDDTVLETPMGDAPTDGIVLWLRDPGLDELARALPRGLGLHSFLETETALVFMPSGRVEPYNDREVDLNRVLRHEVVTRKGGYTLEVAVRLEAFEVVTSLPLSQVAFRVELLDGDEEDRPGYQTVVSTVPNRGDDAPRYAATETVPMLPTAPAHGTPPRATAIGRWLYSDGAWSFVSFEAPPKHWVPAKDHAPVRAALLDSMTWCQASRHDARVVDAYVSPRNGAQTALFVCGDRAARGQCPARASTRVLLVRLDADGRVESEIEVFGEPASQCATAPVAGEEYFSHLSLLPVDVLSSSVWAVGWTRDYRERGLAESSQGFTLLNTQYDTPYLGTTTLQSRSATTGERTLANSAVYFTFVDDDDDVDICQIETVVEQTCTSFDRGCEARAHGTTRLTHVQLWSRDKRRYERYDLSKHPGCPANFELRPSRGYLLVQLPDRLGLVPPRTSASSNDQLKLF